MLIAKLGNWLITRALIEPCTYWLEPPFFTIKGHAISHNVDRKTEEHTDRIHTHDSHRERDTHHFGQRISASGGNTCARRPVTLATVPRRPARRRAEKETITGACTQPLPWV